MEYSDEVMRLTALYSENNMLEKVYIGDLPKNVLKMFDELNKENEGSIDGEFIKILPGHEIVNGEPIKKKKWGNLYVCYVDRLPKEEVEEMKKYNKQMKNKYGFDFVTFLKG